LNTKRKCAAYVALEVRLQAVRKRQLTCHGHDSILRDEVTTNEKIEKISRGSARIRRTASDQYSTFIFLKNQINNICVRFDNYETHAFELRHVMDLATHETKHVQNPFKIIFSA